MTTTTTAAASITFTVYADRLPDLRARLATINKRASKYGFKPAVLVVVREFVQSIKQSEFHDRIYYRMAEILLTGETPVIAGWTLAAVIKPAPGLAQNLICTFPGFDSDKIPAEFRTAKLCCAHCGTNRRRAETFLIWNETEGFKQIGRQCLGDYTGALSPQAAAWAATFPEKIRELGEDREYTGAGAVRHFPTESFLTRVSASIRNHGWVSRSQASAAGKNSTATTALIDLKLKNDDPDRLPLIEADTLNAESVRAWVAEQADRADLTTFDYNVFIAAGSDYVTADTAGFAAYAVVMFDKAMSNNIAANSAKGAASDYIGTIGGKITVNVTVKSVRKMANDYGPRGGMTFIYGFIDAAGNELIWWASSDQSVNVGDTLTLTAKVKKHDEYKGVRQTTITHGKITGG